MTLMKVNNRPAYRSFNGLVNELFGNFETFPTRTIGTAFPPVNIVENETGYHLEFAVPGRSKENFKVKVEENQLTISYEEKKETEERKDFKTIRNEFNINAFSRSFTLNNKVNADAIQAKYEEGILKVLVPKKEEAKPLSKEISIG